MTSMANHHQQRTTDSLQQQQLEQESPISLLPEGCIADIISRTTPRDACRLALVSKIFRSAAKSDVVWERFLPPDYQTIISKSFPWPPFLEFAELIHGFWLEIHGKISTRILSPGTNYTAYLVFKSRERFYGFENQPVEVSVGLVGTKNQKRYVFLHEMRSWGMQYSLGFGWWQLPIVFGGNFPKKRGDEWHEVELGDFFNAGDEDGELEMSILEVRSGHWKSGLIVQGIEIRPKQGV